MDTPFFTKSSSPSQLPTLSVYIKRGSDREKEMRERERLRKEKKETTVQEATTHGFLTLSFMCPPPPSSLIRSLAPPEEQSKASAISELSRPRGLRASVARSASP
ncbi:hypothetical protein VNO80_11599 [Phaseolus coccineus]|uniref:Uncharacterized protein n=1 Tax=Phaseolus coccineus TaxID=3886 RepID=A0AAN9RFN2_PHACN